MKAPDVIYLQTSYEGEPMEDDWTWCADRINDSDAKYVRADIVAGRPSAEQFAVVLEDRGKTERVLHEINMRATRMWRGTDEHDYLVADLETIAKHSAELLAAIPSDDLDKLTTQQKPTEEAMTEATLQIVERLEETGADLLDERDEIIADQRQQIEDLTDDDA